MGSACNGQNLTCRNPILAESGKVAAEDEALIFVLLAVIGPWKVRGNKRLQARNSAMRKRVYRKELKRLQTAVVAVQDWVKARGQRIGILFEGRDAMLEAKDDEESPWHIVSNEGKPRGRLNGITLLLLQLRNENKSRETVVLPERNESATHDDTASMSGRRFVPEEF